ncbi:MAG TPA: hypothetical protein VF403_20250 [Kofleriaceae bacterium]
MKEIALKKFPEIATNLGVTKLSATEAQAIVGLARLAIDADRTVDGDELDLYDDLADLICELAGADADADEIVETEDRKPRGDDDRVARIADGAGKLTTTSVRELGYAVAFMLTIADLAIQPDEDAYLAQLQDALVISDDRQAEIAATVSDAIAQ